VQAIGPRTIDAQLFRVTPNAAPIRVSEYLRSSKSPSFSIVLQLTSIGYGHQFNAVQRHLPAINLGTVGKPSWYSPTHLRILDDQPFRKLLPETLTEGMLRVANKTPKDNRDWTERSLFKPGVLGVTKITGQAPGSPSALASVPISFHGIADS
jgi:hypothetical protein